MQALKNIPVDKNLNIVKNQYVSVSFFLAFHQYFFYLYKKKFFVYNTIYVVTDGEKL